MESRHTAEVLEASADHRRQVADHARRMDDREMKLLRSLRAQAAAQHQAMPSAEELSCAASNRSTEAVTAAYQHNATLSAQTKHALGVRATDVRELTR